MRLTNNTYILLDDDHEITMIFQTDSLESIADSWVEFETLQLKELQ